MPPPTPPLATRHNRSGRQAAMPIPPEHMRWSTEHNGRQGLAETATPSPGMPERPSPCVYPLLLMPSPGLRYTTLHDGK